MQRITQKQLESLARDINEEQGKPLEARADGSWNVGSVYIDYANGGVALFRIVDENGTVNDLLGGHMPKRDLYHRMMGFLRISWL